MRKIMPSALPSADEMHQLDRIAIADTGVTQPRAPNDFAIELDHDRPRVEPEVSEQVEERDGTRDPTPFAVDRHAKLAHAPSSQGASSASAAAAGSSACQRAPIAATP